MEFGAIAQFEEVETNTVGVNINPVVPHLGLGVSNRGIEPFLLKNSGNPTLNSKSERANPTACGIARDKSEFGLKLCRNWLISSHSKRKKKKEKIGKKEIYEVSSSHSCDISNEHEIFVDIELRY